MTLSGSNARPASSAAFPARDALVRVGEPFADLHPHRAEPGFPKPAQSAPGLFSPPVSANTLGLDAAIPQKSQSRPCRLTTRASSHAVPSRAQKYCKLEIPGRNRISASGSRAPRLRAAL